MGTTFEVQSVPAKILFKKQIKNGPKTPPPGPFRPNYEKSHKNELYIKKRIKNHVT